MLCNILQAPIFSVRFFCSAKYAFEMAFLGVQKRIRLSDEYPCATCSYLHCIYAQFYCCLLKLCWVQGAEGLTKVIGIFGRLNTRSNKTKHTLTFLSTGTFSVPQTWACQLANNSWNVCWVCAIG